MITYVAHEMNGVYSRDKRVTLDSRLRYMPYAQAGWLHDSYNNYIMYSYSSRVFRAEISSVGVEEISVRNCDAAMNYSRTTSRQVTMALREIGLSDSVIARLKKWFTSDSSHVTAVYIGRGEWVDGCTAEVIA